MGRKSSSNNKTRSKSKKKIHLVFDTEARRKFLTGFHTRKLQRKKKALEDAERQRKEEEKRLKDEARKKYKELVNVRDIILQPEELHTEEMQLENHFVSIRELSTAEISLKNKWIGVNQVQNDDNGETSAEIPEKIKAKKALKKQAISKVRKSVQKQGESKRKKKKNYKNKRQKN
ncbi:hypothetical protein J437_LFUL014323 [Ladona fulva]|uniref:Nucleolar protein 12 n=1 Tax=Ladona fulva TaxID=123851 RepID=A0A8K0KGQ1_LADFU|nr:hypothetical protein J437_LFUL014323 [Ladona fulva]